MGFKPSDAVEALDYDFRPDVESFGTIPEPTQDALEELFADLRRIGTQGSLDSLAALQPGVDNPGQALAEIPEDVLGNVTGALVAAVAKLCQGTPSEDEINALPIRYRQAFIDWLLGETTNPTKRTTASRPSVVRSNGAGLAG